MRIAITAIVVWAILLGIFATGVKVMALSPQDVAMQQVTAVADTVRPDLQKAEIDRSDQRSVVKSSSGDVVR